MLKTYLPFIQFLNDFLTIRKWPFYLMQDLMILERRKKNHHFTIFSNMEFINPVVFKHACNEKGKKKKKTTLARLETIISCSPLRHGKAAETLRSLPPKLDFDYQTTPHTPSKACSHCSHTFSFFFNFLI